MDRKTQSAFEAAIGSKVQDKKKLHGGDINEVYVVTTENGEKTLLKTHERQIPRFYECEAQGLEWLRSAGALRVPSVKAVDALFLALEYVESSPRHPQFEERLGAGLADLHRCGAPRFGFENSNFIGTLLQRNDPEPNWCAFYRDQRLAPLIKKAVDHGSLPSRFVQKFDRLFERLDELVGASEPPARLHGDLWSGNLHVDESGAPCLIDPAVYGGHREMDLAMMHLFGGFGPRVFAAYHDRYPLSADAAKRRGLYQIYPLLVHVNLFGSSYVGALENTLQQYL